MQSKFTQGNLLSLCAKAVTLFLFVAAFGQMTFAQERPAMKKKGSEALRAQKEAVSKTSTTVHSVGPVPTNLPSPIKTDPIQIEAGSPFTSAFLYQAVAAGVAQFHKGNLINTTTTPIGPTVAFGFPGAAAWVTTTNKLYVVDQLTPFALYTVDTLSGIRTFIANCTGVPQANLTGMTWDPSTNTMYGVSTSITVSQIFTMNIATGVCTPIGSATATCAGAIQLNAAPGGSLFSADIVADNLYRWNKSTGAATLIGSLGIDANFGMDGHWDLSDGQYFWAAFNNGTFQAQLRTIDTLTGGSTLIGNYAVQQMATLGLYPVPQAPCTGTPAPGNTVASPNPVCLNANFVLTPEFSTIGSGVTYQWQSSPNGTAWTDIPGATSGALVRQQTVATYYRVRVACGANSAFTVPLQVTMAPISACYCVPTYGNGCTLGDYIARVVVATLDNSSLCSTPPYTYYAAVPDPTLIRGATYPMQVTVGPDTFGQWVAAWLDANQDGDFNDPGEFLAAPVNAGASGTATLNIVIPLNATLGTTRLRIRGGDDVAQGSGQACGASNSSYGEAEDYDVFIEPCVQGVFTAQPNNASVQCSGTTTISVGTTGSALTFLWEKRPNSASPWTLASNGNDPLGVTFSGATTSTLTLSNTSSALNGYQFRAIMQGPCTAPDFSAPATLTVTPLVATVTPTSATICLGQIQNIKLTNISAPVQLINEGFNTVSPLPLGWASQNLSNPLGPFGWFQGLTAAFPAQSGPADSYIAANWQNTTTTGVGTISNWLFAPNITLNNGNTFKFWTRKIAPDTYPDRLQVRMSTNGGSTNVGATETSVGDFTTLLLDINPTLITGVYPTAWTEYTITISGLAGPTSGRLAFRYFVTNAGGAAPNSDFIGIDNVTYTAGVEAVGVWTASPAAPNTMFTNAGATTPYTGTPINGIYVNPTVTTTYTVIYTTANPTCVSLPTSVTVFVERPVGAITQPTNKSVCVGGNTSFTASAVGGPFTYQWLVSTNGGATYSPVSGGTSATLNLNGVVQTMHNNKYRLKFTAAACASTDTSAAATLTVNPLPIVTITSPTLNVTPGVVTSITASSTPGAQTPTSWTWFYNGSTLVTVPASNTNVISNIGVDRLGTYQVRVTDVNGCVSLSNELVIGAQASDKLWIYPNPTNGVFQVRVYFDGPNADFREVRIFNEKGQLVLRKAFDLFVNMPPYLQMDFDMTAFPAGTYVVKTEEKFTGKIKSGKLIIQ